MSSSVSLPITVVYDYSNLAEVVGIPEELQNVIACLSITSPVKLDDGTITYVANTAFIATHYAYSGFDSNCASNKEVMEDRFKVLDKNNITFSVEASVHFKNGGKSVAYPGSFKA